MDVIGIEVRSNLIETSPFMIWKWRGKTSMLMEFAQDVANTS